MFFRNVTLFVFSRNRRARARNGGATEAECVPESGRHCATPRWCVWVLRRRLREDFARVFGDLPLPQDPTRDNPERAREAQEASDRG